MCTRLAHWVRRRDRTGRVLVVANQRSGVLSRYGLTRDEADRGAWTVDHAGSRLEGAAALNRMMHELGGYPAWLSALYRVGPLAAAEEALYRWFVPRRSRFRRFGVTPECGEDASGCA